MVTLLLLLLGFLLGVALTGVVAWGCFKRLVAPVLERYEKLKREFYTLEDRIKEFEANVARIRKEKVAYEDRYTVADKELKYKMMKVEALEKEILVLKSDVGEFTSQLATANAMLTKLSLDLEKADIGNTMLSNLAKETRYREEQALKDVMALKDKNQTLSSDLQELKDVLDAKTTQYKNDLSILTNQRDLVLKNNSELLAGLRLARKDLSKLDTHGVDNKDIIARSFEFMSALDVLDGNSDGDRKVVEDYMMVTGSHEALLLPFENSAEIVSRETQKLNPGITVKQLTKYAPEFEASLVTVKLGVPFGAEQIILDATNDGNFETEKSQTRDLVSGDSRTVVQENTAPSKKSILDVLEYAEAIFVKPSSDVSLDDIDRLFIEEDERYDNGWHSLTYEMKLEAVSLLSCEVQNAYFDEDVPGECSDSVRCAVGLINSSVLGSCFDFSEIKPSFLQTIMGAENKLNDASKRNVFCVEKILGMFLNNRLKGDNRFFFLKKGVLGYLLVNVLRSTSHVSWLYKFYYMFFELCRMQLSLSKDAFCKLLISANSFGFINQLKFPNTNILAEINVPNFFASSDRDYMVSTLESADLVDISSRLFKKAQGVNESDSYENRSDMELFMAKVVLCASKQQTSISVKTV